METAKEQQVVKKKGSLFNVNWDAFFFWLGYIILLAASVPHAAYVLAAYTDLSQTEWFISYAGASLIEFSIYISTFAVYKIFKMGNLRKNWAAIGGLLLWNILCTLISWMLNSQHAAHFRHADMLTNTADIPLQQYTQYMASIWPVLGIIFTLVSRVVTQKVEEIGTVRVDNRSPEQIKRDAAIQRAIMVEEAKTQIIQSRINARKRSVAISANVKGLREGIQHGIKGDQEIDFEEDFTDLDNVSVEEVEDVKELPEPKQEEAVEVHEPQPIKLLTQEDKMALSVEAYQNNPNITDEEMGNVLGITNPNKAHFWVLKAQEAAKRSQEKYSTLTNEERLAIAINALKKNPHITDEEMAKELGTENKYTALRWRKDAQREIVPKQEQEEIITHEVQARVEKLKELSSLETATNLTSLEELVPVEEEVVVSNGHSIGFTTAPTQTITLPPVETKKPKEAYYQTIEGEHVKYSSSRPYFEIDGLTFASIGSAYQRKHTQNVYRDDLGDEKITHKNLYTLIKDHKVAREYVRLVKTRKPFGKDGDAFAMCIAIHPQVRDHILDLLV